VAEERISHHKANIGSSIRNHQRHCRSSQLSARPTSDPIETLFDDAA
jgi:hypothetical protein